MKILYLAKHGSGGNDDEGAISHALTLLGHEVLCMTEDRGWHAHKERFDFLLCHHLREIAMLNEVKRPKIFWCFDRIDSGPDPMLGGRNLQRIGWATEMSARCDLGFFTDGDWVQERGASNTHWLPQGFDERLSQYVDLDAPKNCDVLFTGISRNAGEKRRSFVELMERTYGNRFDHIPRGVHGKKLAQAINGAKVIVAPDFPIGPCYCSNRLYLTAGLGGYLLHPQCEQAYVPTYLNQVDLLTAINVALKSPAITREVAEKCRAETMAKHLYRHRCEKLVKIVKEKLL